MQDRLTVPVDPRSILLLRNLVGTFSRRMGWDQPAENRLMLAIEEAVLFFCEEAAGEKIEQRRQLMVKLTDAKGVVEVEMVTAPSKQNAEKIIASLPGTAVADSGENLSLLILSRTVSGLKHMQYHQGDYLTFRVDSTA